MFYRFCDLSYFGVAKFSHNQCFTIVQKFKEPPI